MAKEFLSQVRKLDILIQHKHLEKEKLRETRKLNFSCGGTNELINQYESKLVEDIKLLIEKKKEVQNVIDRLKDADLIEVLYKRYFRNETWEKIASDMYISFVWVHKLHAKALKEVEAILKGNGNEEDIK